MESSLVPCPTCSHQVSTSAESCPNCGHPLQEGIVKKFEHVQKIGGVVLFLISLILVGVQTTLLKMIGMANAGPGAEEISLLKVFLQTAPFTVAVAMIVTVWIKDSTTRRVWEGTVLSAIVLAVSIYLNSWLTGDSDSTVPLGNPFVMVMNSLLLYWRLYGAALFISSLILGSFLAWSINRLWPASLTKS